MTKEQRVFAHWKSFGPRNHPRRAPFVYGEYWEEHYEGRTKDQDNEIWLLLARTHKMKVREIKDIVTAERARRKAASKA